MASVNKVILVGNLGADPEIKVFSSGAKTARLRIATSETFTNKTGERVTNTEWHTVNVWRNSADFAEKYLAKGKQVYVEGRLQTRNFQDKDGVTKYITEITGDTLQILGPKPGDSEVTEENKQSHASNATAKAPADVPDLTEDDLPF